MSSFAGNNVRLIGVPALTEPNGSFSPAFLEAMMGLGSGRHQFTVGLYIEHGGSLVDLNEVSAVYDGSGGTAARNFRVDVTNSNSGRTRHVIILNTRTLSEEIVEFPPRSTRTLELFRGGSYELLVYDQDQRKDNAARFAEVDESDHGATLTVR
jgi:hypothetical protein